MQFLLILGFFLVFSSYINNFFVVTLVILKRIKKIKNQIKIKIKKKSKKDPQILNNQKSLRNLKKKNLKMS